MHRASWTSMTTAPTPPRLAVTLAGSRYFVVPFSHRMDPSPRDANGWHDSVVGFVEKGAISALLVKVPSGTTKANWPDGWLGTEDTLDETRDSIDSVEAVSDGTVVVTIRTEGNGQATMTRVTCRFQAGVTARLEFAGVSRETSPGVRDK